MTKALVPRLLRSPLPFSDHQKDMRGEGHIPSPQNLAEYGSTSVRVDLALKYSETMTYCSSSSLSQSLSSSAASISTSGCLGLDLIYP